MRSTHDHQSRLSARHSSTREGMGADIPEIRKHFTYDKSGELIVRMDNFTGDRSYTYDAAGRITGSRAGTAYASDRSEFIRTQSRPDNLAETLFKEESFLYDPASNLISTGEENLPLTVFLPPRQKDKNGSRSEDISQRRILNNRLNELETFLFTYDAYGRVIEKKDQDRRTTWKYRYNSENQLLEVNRNARGMYTRVTFSYDALGRRISKTDGTNETRFLWDGMTLMREERFTHTHNYYSSKPSTSEGTTSTYLYEQDSYVPLARLDQKPEEKEPRIYYFHCNASGQPEELTDTDGNIIWQGRYYVWGKLSFEKNTRKAPWGFEQNLRMQGQYADRDTDLCYNTFRYYDPDVGRFTCEDPIGLFGGLNLYQYAPNPLMWIDPWGWVCFTGGAARAAQKGFPGIGTTKNGGPNFKNTDYLFKTTGNEKNIVNFKLTGRLSADFDKANYLAGFKKTPVNYTWHHVDNFNPQSGRATLQLVRTEAHKATFPHKGSVGQYNDMNGMPYGK